MLFGRLKIYYLKLLLNAQTGNKIEKLNQICEMVILNAGLQNAYGFFKTLSYWPTTKFLLWQSN